MYAVRVFANQLRHSAINNKKDFFYVCPVHLKDRGFCSPIVDAEQDAKKKRDEELAREIENVKREYEEKQKRRKEKEKEKEKEKGKEKDKEAEKKREKDEKPEDSDNNAEKEKTEKVRI
jgi:AAA-ATPase Vps4-associated protein 1